MRVNPKPTKVTCAFNVLRAKQHAELWQCYSPDHGPYFSSEANGSIVRFLVCVLGWVTVAGLIKFFLRLAWGTFSCPCCSRHPLLLFVNVHCLHYDPVWQELFHEHLVSHFTHNSWSATARCQFFWTLEKALQQRTPQFHSSKVVTRFEISPKFSPKHGYKPANLLCSEFRRVGLFHLAQNHWWNDLVIKLVLKMTEGPSSELVKREALWTTQLNVQWMQVNLVMVVFVKTILYVQWMQFQERKRSYYSLSTGWKTQSVVMCESFWVLLIDEIYWTSHFFAVSSSCLFTNYFQQLLLNMFQFFIIMILYPKTLQHQEVLLHQAVRMSVRKSAQLFLSSVFVTWRSIVLELSPKISAHLSDSTSVRGRKSLQ